MAKIRFALGLFLLLTLLSSVSPVRSAVASPDEVKWSPVNIPAEGKPGNWILADGSDIRHLTIAIDGTLYGYANPSGTDYTLFKSADGGYSWSYTGKVQDSIVALATAPHDASIVYYTTTSKVYKSTDSGNSFTLLPPNPGGTGSNNVEITSIAVAQGDSIAIGTRDTDNGQYGGIYTMDNESFTWLNTDLGNYDVYAVAFSLNFAADGQLVAVITDETDTFVTTRIGNSGWSQIIDDTKLDKDNSGTPTPVSVDTSAAIAFPDDYEAIENYTLFVAIDAGTETGDVYKIKGGAVPGGSVATDLNIGSAYGLSNVDITTLAVTGNATAANLLAGAGGSARVYFSPDGGSNWTRSTKPPTGQSKTYVLMASDFSSSGRAYAATSGTESAFSYTTDGSVTWNQIGLIDTVISSLLDLALSPGYSQDNTLFLITYGGGKHSLWRSLNCVSNVTLAVNRSQGL